MSAVPSTELEKLRQRIAELEGKAAELSASVPALDILESVGEACSALDSEWRYTYVNRQAEVLARIPRSELLGKSIWDVFPALKTTNAAKNLYRAMEERVHTHYEDYFPPYDIWVEVDAYPAAGGLTMLVRDVSERRKAQAALTESEQSHRFLAEGLPQIVWRATPDFQITYINSHWFEYTGLSWEETQANGWSQVIHPEDFSNTVQRATEAAEIGADFSAEYRLRRASDGEYRWHLGRSRLIRNAAGVRQWIGTALDIHSRKQVEKERIELLRRERSLREEAEQALERQRTIEQQLILLVEASSALIASVESGEILRTILSLAQRFVGADAYAVWRRVEQGPIWKILAEEGLSADYCRTLREQIGVSGMPAGPVAIEDVEQTSHLRHRLEHHRAEGIVSMLTVPLRIHGQTEGTIVFYYRTRHLFTEIETRVAAGLANLASTALGTAELYERESGLRQLAELAEQRAHLLADAGALLSSSLDYETTLARVAELAAPVFADWASVDIVDDQGQPQRLAVQHIDPQKIALAYEYHRRFPPRETDPSYIAIRTGESFLVEEIPDSALVASARNAEHLQAMRELGLTSVIVAPLVARGRTLGILTFVSAESGRRYTRADLALAEEIARCAATAVENAQLYRSVRTSEERYRSLISATTSIVWTINPQGEFIEPQNSWEAYTGQSWEEHRGFGWANAIHQDDRDAVLAVWRRSRDEGKTYACEGRVWHAPSGQYRYFTGRATPVRNADGAIREWVGTVTDIHEKKEAEESLVATNAALMRSNRALEQFAYSASHDLQEPLRMVAIFSELIRKKYSGRLDDNADDFLRHIVQGASRMRMLVNDLLAYTQAPIVDEESGEPVEVSAAVQQALSNLESAISESEAVIEYGELPCLRVHPVHLRQLFQNLIGNAIKYRGARPPRIVIAATRHERDWLFSVSDNGIGIDPRYREHIFGIFKRLHTAEKYSGTGIGLALCQRIVEQYRGRIWVESSLGEGAVFQFTLPA